MVRWPFRSRINYPEERERIARIESKVRDILEEKEAQKVAERVKNKNKGLMTGTAINIYNKQRGNSYWLLFVLLIVAVIGYILYKMGYGTAALRIITLVVIIGLFIALIIEGFILSSKEKDEAALFIALALIVWAIDLMPSSVLLPIPIIGTLLGSSGPYAGFVFDLSGVLSTNWAAVITSGLVLVFLLFGMVKDLSQKRLIGVVIAVSLILFINEFTKIYTSSAFFHSGFKASQWNYAILAFIVLAFIITFKFRDKISSTDFADWPTYLFMALTLSFFWVNFGWTSNIRAVIHVIYILFFGFIFLRKQSEDNPAFWHIIIPVLLLIDFYGYGLMWNYGWEFMKFIPPLVLFVVGYCLDKSKTNYPVWVFLFIIALIIGFSWPAYGIDTGGIQFEARKTTDVRELYSQFKDRLRDIIEGRLDIATAGLYRGSVEKNRYESLGVYFSNLRAADPRFYEKEPITVWGTIRSKTYKDVVVVDFNCYRWKDTKKIKAEKVIPNFKFPIFTLDEVDTECVFMPSQLYPIKPGANTITFSSDYNFGTDAYIKAYFIDRDRYRAYAREDIDVLKEFGIKDKNPVAVFTNGPVEIGLDAGPIITVSEGYAIKPTVGITLTNRQELSDKEKKIISRWDGKIKNITELILLLPPGIKLANDDGKEGSENSLQKYCKSDKDEEKVLCPCSTPFYPYDAGKCKVSCSEQVLIPCNKACKDSNPSKEGADDTEGAKKCIEECVDTFNRCNEECNTLFQVSEGEGDTSAKYTGYALDISSIEFKDLNKDIDKHRSFVCRIDPTKDVLDDTPITTRYIRVRARYNYLLENSVSVTVELLPLEAISLILPDEMKLIDDAVKNKFDIDVDVAHELVLAIAKVESDRRHCCKEVEKTTAGTCKGTAENSCEGRVITSYDKSSVGYMQINVNKNAHLAGKVCNPRQTIYDKDCNIQVGTYILRTNYQTYKNGIPPQTLAKFCPPNEQSERYKKYLSYRGWDAAVRAYIGLGCRPEASCRKACEGKRDPLKCEQNCIDRNINYVENVFKAFNSIKGAEITNPSVWQSVAPTEEIVREEETITQSTQGQQIPITQPTSVSPPENVQASFDDTNRVVTITWSKSQSQDVTNYKVVYEDFVNNAIIHVPINACDKKAGEFTYQCSHNVDPNRAQYKYYVFAYRQDGQPSTAVTTQVNIPPENIPTQ